MDFFEDRSRWFQGWGHRNGEVLSPPYGEVANDAWDFGDTLRSYSLPWKKTVPVLDDSPKKNGGVFQFANINQH